MKLLSTAFLCIGLVFSNAYGQEAEQKTGYIEGEMLVQITAEGSIRELAKKAPENFEFTIGEYISPPMRVYLINFNHHNVPNYQMLNWLYEQEEVTLAQNNHYLELRSTLPNDGAAFTSQWHHNNTGQTGGTVDADIDSDLAWDITTGGQTATNDDIVICLIESGNLDHNDIVGNKWINAVEDAGTPGVDDDGNGYIDDISGWNPVAGNGNYGTGGHGTNCLGMMGAVGNNNLLVAGANWDVKLMVVGGYSISTDANAVQAYTYPLEMRKLWNSSGGSQGAFVVATSSSWGIDAENPAAHPIWCQFYDTLGYHGVLNVGATTNSNLNVDAVGDMPTACASPYMIGVGRTDHNDNTAGGYGQTTIEFGAPGINVVTTANTNTTTTTTGTSFSCPLTAGVIGLAYSIPCTDFMAIVNADPKQGADLVLQALLDGTDVIPGFATKFVTGGRLNSRNTLDELMMVACSGSLCLTPSAISTSNIGDNQGDVNFTPYASGSSTKLYWRQVGTIPWTEVPNVTSPYTISGLTACEDYEYYMKTYCGTDSSSNTNIATFSTTGCGACIDLNYCASQATDGIDEWIEDFAISTYTNASGNDGGFGDFTATSSIQLDKTVPYTFTLTPDWGGTLYDEYTRIWIDLDQSGTFEAGEILYDQGAAAQTTPVTGSITVPGTALNGSTRMRIQMAYQGGGQATLPPVCGSFQWGEVEDYCVDIQDANPCNLTVTETIVDASCNGAADGSVTLNTVTGGTAPYTYSWAPGGQTTQNITGVAAGSHTVTITDGAACSSNFSFTVNEPAAMTANSAITDVTCNGDTDGAIDLTVSNNQGAMTFLWTPGGATTEDISGLSPGNYSVDVTDGNGCTATFAATVGEPGVLTGTTSTTSIQFGNDGAINLTVTGGTPPYSYNWDSGFATTEDLTGLNVAGSYTCVITDANGCTTTVSATVDSELGIGANELNAMIIYPNPSHGLVNVAFKTEVDATIIVYNSMGQKLIETTTLGNQILELDLNEFATGVYVLNISTEAGDQRVERITIKR